MRVRHIVSKPKTLKQDTVRWSDKDLPPRWCPIFEKTKPIRGDWRWRAAKAEYEGAEFVLVAQCNPARGNWKSILILQSDDGPSVVARFECHDSHPGLHVHSDCERSGREVGASGMDALARFPDNKSLHRRTNTWTVDGFWNASLKFFRIQKLTTEPAYDDLFSTF